MTIDVDSLPIDNGDEIERILRTFYLPLLQRGYEDAALTLGLEAVFDLDNPIIQEQLDDLALLVRRVADSTRDEIRALVGKQAAEGWTIEQLADEIAKLGFDHAEKRAERIARTETADAYARGNHMLYVESGVVGETEVINGPEPCAEVCQPLSGKRTPIGEDVIKGRKHAPYHPGCTCDDVPVLRGR